MTMNQYYPHLPSARTVRNASLGERIGSAQKYIQMNLMNLWSSCTTGPGEKSQVTCFDVVFVYFISAGAGDQAIILDKRCSVTPLKCF
jgi:hypothetical protein